MKTIEISGDKLNVFTKEDIQSLSFQIKVNEARELWATKAKEAFVQMGDYGSCVLGDGIEVWYLAPRCKYPTRHMIIRSSEIAPCQGSCVYEKPVPEVLAFLKERGIEARYNHGHLD